MSTSSSATVLGWYAHAHEAGGEGPKAHLLVAEANVSQVCAYLRLHDHDGDDPRDLTPPGQTPAAQTSQPDGEDLPPDSVAAEAHPRFDPDAPIDTTSDDASCAHAFMTAAVSNGTFTLAHLWPGEYKLVYFKQDGSRLNQTPQDVDLQPGQGASISGATRL